MAGVSSKELKNRIRSLESTRQITKAMEMVATSKLRKAQRQAESSAPYFRILEQTIASIVSANREFTSPYLTERIGDKVLYVVIGGDRGLAGGYNSNVFKTVTAAGENKQMTVLPVGRKTAEYFRGKGIPLFTEAFRDAEAVTVGDCFTMAKEVAKSFLSKDFDRVELAYTAFDSILSQRAMRQRMLPLTRQSDPEQRKGRQILYEPDAETVFARIVPEYLGGMIYGALCQSRASEQAARRTAMDAATKNANEMIEDLSLKFNRARQAAITQEITEIVAGNQE